MQLPWRDIDLGCGPISTSLTGAETEALDKLAWEKDVVEVGAAYGYSTVVLATVAKRVVSFDPHEGYGAMPGSFETWRANLDRYGVTERVILCRETFNYRRALGYCPYGLVFIDGDHRYETVKGDILTALALLTPNGVIACHDYGEDSCPGVKQAIDELLPDGHLEMDTLWVYRK